MIHSDPVIAVGAVIIGLAVDLHIVADIAQSDAGPGGAPAQGAPAAVDGDGAVAPLGGIGLPVHRHHNGLDGVAGPLGEADGPGGAMVHIEVVAGGDHAAVVVNGDVVVLIVIGGVGLDGHGALHIAEFHFHPALQPGDVAAVAVDGHIVVIPVCSDDPAIDGKDQALDILVGVIGGKGDIRGLAVVDGDLILGALVVAVAIRIKGNGVAGLAALHINLDVAGEGVKVDGLAAVVQGIDPVGAAIQSEAILVASQGHLVSGRLDGHRGDLCIAIGSQLHGDRVTNLGIGLAAIVAVHIAGGVDGQPGLAALAGSGNGHISRNGWDRHSGHAVGAPGNPVGVTVDGQGGIAGSGRTILAAVLNPDGVQDAVARGEHNTFSFALVHELGYHIGRHIADSHDGQLVLASQICGQGGNK